MPLTVSKDQASVPRVAPAENQARAPAQQTAASVGQPAPANALQSADPRSLAVLSQALNAFLDQINGANASAANPAFGDAATAYGDVTDATPTAPAMTAGANSPAAMLKELKDDFDGLFSRLQSMSASRPVAGSAAHDQLKAEAFGFAGKLAQAVEQLGEPAMSVSAASEPQPAAFSQPASDNEAAAQPALAKEPSTTQRPSLFSTLSERLQRHLDEL